MVAFTELRNMSGADFLAGVLPMLAVVFVPLLAGLLLLAARPLRESRGARTAYVSVALLLNLVLVGWVQLRRPEGAVILFRMAADVPVALQNDVLARFFLVLTAVLWLAAGIFAFGYLRDDRRAGVFFGAYLLGFSPMAGIALAGNLVTLYLFYELLTLLTALLVFYPGTHESAMAGLKYLFYSIGGAFLALIGIFLLSRLDNLLIFRPGGVRLFTDILGGEDTVLVAAFLMLLGVGAKAGLFPLHGWLPTAHPVAPAPASAVLSGLIVKAGVFFSIRVVFYTVGAERLRGSWVQTAWLTLALVTVFLGSMLAFLEPVLKKRLAYSTVSQASYILFGLGLLNRIGLVGGLLHMVFHAVIKTGLFLAAGSYITQTGCTRVSDLTGTGRAMPVTTACFGCFGLALVGIPPFSGFVSKWYLAMGAVSAGAGWFSLLGPAVLLISALLTAGYLFPPVVRGFFAPAKEGVREAPAVMVLPLAVLAVLCLLLGLFAMPLASWLTVTFGGLV